MQTGISEMTIASAASFSCRLTVAYAWFESSWRPVPALRTGGRGGAAARLDGPALDDVADIAKPQQAAPDAVGGDPYAGPFLASLLVAE